MLPATLTLLEKKLIGSEGFRQFPYKDSKGIWTVGHGINLESGEFSKQQVQDIFKNGVTVEWSLNWLRNKIYSIDAQFFKVTAYKALNEARRAVLVDMAYNMGVATVLTFVNMWAAIRAGNFVKAAHEMLWNDAAGTIKTDYYIDVKGRAKELAAIMQEGVWHA